MSEGEHGQTDHTMEEVRGSPGTHRSASPAKRSAKVMEAGDDIKVALPANTGLLQTHEQTSETDVAQYSTVPNSIAASSLDGLATGNTSATSLPSVDMADAQTNFKQNLSLSANVPSIDEQVAKVHELANRPINEGDRCAVLSTAWLRRVLSRTTEGLRSDEYTKSDREGDIGPLDSATIVPADGFREPILKDRHNSYFIPLKHGLQLGDEMEALPFDAYGLIVGWYGAVPGQKPVIRYAHDTAPKDAAQTNVQYELYPPIFTVRKVPVSNTVTETVSEREVAVLLKMKSTQKTRGQMSPDDALRLVSSRFERYQQFLARAKDFAGVAEQTKVKTWRTLKPPVTDETDNATRTPLKLNIDREQWTSLQEGVDVEHIAAKDETSNVKYNGSSTMDTYQLFQDTVIILEELPVADADRKPGPKPMKAMARPPSTSGRSSPAPHEGMVTRGRAGRTGRTRGTAGLQNLGNTCYMNSALQCIRSVQELAIYFLQNKYKHEINNNNPLGHKGAMATKYADVLAGLYKPGAIAFSPSAFKSTLGRIMPTFSGFGQQDSQEFLSFLVDALHEDLNRIQSKPYRENPDSDDLRVNDPKYIVELGEVYRQNHRDRNDSIAMDLFSGFYKNTMECPNCEKVSVTFDPYSSLTLQLPIGNTYSHTFIFAPRFDTPVRYDLDYERSTTVRELKAMIAAKYGDVDAGRLWMVEVYQHKIYRHFEDSTVLSEVTINTNDWIYIYELDHDASRLQRLNRFRTSYGRRIEDDEDEAAKRDVNLIPIYHRQLIARNGVPKMTLIPGLISLSNEECKDYTVIQKKVLLSATPLTSREFIDEAAQELDDGSRPEPLVTEQNGIEQADTLEDGYVNVNIEDGTDAGKASQPRHHETQLPDAESPRVTPDQFMDSTYEIPDRLTTQLFSLSYAKGQNHGNRDFITALDDRTIKPLSSRVKALSRRSSTSSGSSSGNDDHSSIVDDEQTPSVSLDDSTEEGTEATTSPAPSVTESTLTLVDEDVDVDETMENKQIRTSGKANKFKSSKPSGKPTKRKDKAMAKREKRLQAKTRRSEAVKERAANKPASSPTTDDDEDSTYYINNGEAILIDWFLEAYDGLFGGNAENEDDMRGFIISDQDGSGFEVMDDPTVTQRRDLRTRRKKFGITLEDCFAETGRREKLSADNAWYCSRCKELRQATKTLEIWTIPDILVLHLKRFGGNRRFNDKIDVLVDYPVEGLDLNDKVGHKEGDKDYTYDLFAVDNHFGGLGGGHYTAVAKNFFDGEWYDYNDSTCTKQGDAPRKSAAAYLLFYRRRSDGPLGPPYLQEIVNRFRSDVEGDESDSGEGRLGGQIGSLHGSPSDYPHGAGAVISTTASRANGPIASASVLDGVGSHGQATSAAGLSQKPTATAAMTTTTQFLTSDDGMDIDDSGKQLQQFRAEKPSWGFPDSRGAEDEEMKSDSRAHSSDSMTAMGSARSSLRMMPPSPSGEPMTDDTEWNNTETEMSFGMSDDHPYGSSDHARSTWQKAKSFSIDSTDLALSEPSPEPADITFSDEH